MTLVRHLTRKSLRWLRRRFAAKPPKEIARLIRCAEIERRKRKSADHYARRAIAVRTEMMRR